MITAEKKFLENGTEVIENGEWDNTYKVMVYNGTAWFTVFQIQADDEQQALDEVMDYCVAVGYTGLYCDLYEIFDNDESEEDYICCGNDGFYFSALSMIEEI